jgi:2-amino-4-hydroxy-6-hydroxymethyldihydropteridine diphosphokinase
MYLVMNDAERSERIFLGIGSNLGNREENLLAALKRIGELPETSVERTSRFHETDPWGWEDQPAFLNAVVEIRSGLGPEALLGAVKRIERELGREPSFKWGPRLIDIDLLVYGDRRLSCKNLTLPHPHILARPFVVEPLREIAPEQVEELERASVSVRSAGSQRPDRPGGHGGGR